MMMIYPSVSTQKKRPGRGRFWFTLGLCCVLMILLAGMMRLILRRTSWVQLPDTDDNLEISVTDPVEPGLSGPVEIVPDTVQAAVRTLSRPKSYCRAVTVTQFWNGGSGSYTSTVTVSDGWTRIDLAIAGGHVRHTLTDGSASYIWYDDETVYYRTPSGTISADNEQHIPTYEDVLTLDKADIIQADYRVFSGAGCIYVETRRGSYQNRYWIGVETGLLEAAETLWNGETVYWMEVSEERETAPDAFILPDGTIPGPS